MREKSQKKRFPPAPVSDWFINSHNLENVATQMLQISRIRLICLLQKHLGSSYRSFSNETSSISCHCSRVPTRTGSQSYVIIYVRTNVYASLHGPHKTTLSLVLQI